MADQAGAGVRLTHARRGDRGKRHFYRLQTGKSFANWYDQTPADFRFTLKGGKFVTHVKRLRGAEQGLSNFLASGVFNLKDKLGPLLWQLPPNLKFDADEVDEFLHLLPEDFTAAAAIAENHEDWLKDRAVVTFVDNHRMRHAMEVRHESFADEALIKLLRKHNVSLVVAETAGKWPMVEDLTADFVYVRLHGAEQLYASGYSDEQLDEWSKRIEAWADGGEPRDARRIDGTPPRKSKRDVYAFFDNTDVKLRAPFDALALMKRLRIEPADARLPRPPEEDGMRD